LSDHSWKIADILTGNPLETKAKAPNSSPSLLENVLKGNAAVAFPYTLFSIFFQGHDFDKIVHFTSGP